MDSGSGQLRCVWIMKIPSTLNKSASEGSFVFTRKFPTGEKRAKQIAGTNYSKIPPATQLLPLILTELGLVQAEAMQFNPSRDSCSKPVKDPIYQIETENGTLWPLLAIDKAGYLFCCLPVVGKGEQGPDASKTSLLDIPSVAGGFSLLTALIDFLNTTSQELPGKIAELPVFLNAAAPFGVVRDDSADNIMARLANKPCALPKSRKIPAWKSSSHKGKASLQISVVERIKASQCANETWQDLQEVFGTVTCKAELEGSASDVAISIVHNKDSLAIPLDGLMVHPCVQRADWQELENTKDFKMAPCRLRFSPPNEQFTLCRYSVKRLKELPIFGTYKMKPEEKKASIDVVLKLNDQVKNSFELCELHIPFHTRSPISHVEDTTTQGSVFMSANRKGVIWNIGQKFTSKDQKVHMTATVTFSGTEQGLPAPTVEDAFCRGNNSYAQLYFKILDFTHSGCQVDSKSIQVSSATKYKLNISREYSSSDYKIWNSEGEGLTTLGS